MPDLDLPRRAVSDRYSVTRWLPPGERLTLAELDGPGCIRHIFLTTTRHEPGNRQTILRIYFDDEPAPYVESPVGDFFGVMHGKKYYPVNTPWLSVSAECGYNCYFPMPFARSARIEVEAGPAGNQQYLMVDWHRYPGQALEEPQRFCARWRREVPTARYASEYLMLDADGPGRFLGFVYGVRLLDDVDRWSHGGSDNIYVDGEGPHPAYLRGIGGEDTFGAGYGGALHSPVETHLHAGLPYYVHEDTGEARPAQRLVGYRFFTEDSIAFERSIQVRFGCMRNDICSTAYWYQAGPVRPFFRMPDWSHLLSLPTRLGLLTPRECFPAGTYDLPLPDCGAWWLCGPFANDGDRAMTGALPAEQSFDPSAVFETEHAADSPYLSPLSRELGRDRARWLRGAAHHGFVDLNHYFRCAAPGVGKTCPGAAVARAVIHAPADTRAALRIGWDDRLVLTAGGRRFEPAFHPCFRAEDFEVALRRGPNEIVLKLSNTPGTNHGGWVFSFSARDESGRVLRPDARVGPEA